MNEEALQETQTDWSMVGWLRFSTVFLSLSAKFLWKCMTGDGFVIF